MSKWLKTALFAVLLVGAGFFFGMICKQIGNAYELVLAPSGELLTLLLWFLLGVGAVTVSTGLVAALVRPVWGGFIALALSGLAMLLGWQVALVSSFLVVVYLLAACVYAEGVARDLNERVRFSVRSTSAGQSILLTALALVACGSLYAGYAAHIEQEGFSLPEAYIEVFMEQLEKQIEVRVPAEEREEVVGEFREGFRRTIDEFVEQRVKPYEELIPLGVAAGLFMPLVTITGLLAWVPAVVLSLVFRLLTVLGVTRVVSETQEVERLVID
jgi:ABC-type multidrug transport system fused ATPase/permease subunit